MEHPRLASLDPLKGAMRVARQSRFHRILGSDISRREPVHPRLASLDPLKGALRVARQSRFHRILGSDISRREPVHPRLASLDPLKGAALAARPELVEGRFRGVLGFDIGARAHVANSAS